MLDGLVGAGSTPRVIMSSNNSGASSFIASSTSIDVRQYLVIDLDQRQRLLGGGGVDRGDGGDRMALIEHLLARHDVARDVPEIDRDPLGSDILEFVVREILRRHDRLDPRQRRGLRGVDRADAGMRVRRAQDAADDRAGHRVVGGVHRLAGDLRHAVRTDRPGPHPFIAAHDIVHGVVSFIGLSRYWSLNSRGAAAKTSPCNGTGAVRRGRPR